MIDALSPEPDARVLEVGTGYGFQTALLSELGAAVFSIERHPELAEEARANLARAGYESVQVVVGDGWQGLESEAPFDGIIVSAAASSLPPAFERQLEEGGRLVIPLAGRRGDEVVSAPKEKRKARARSSAYSCAVRSTCAGAAVSKRFGGAAFWCFAFLAGSLVACSDDPTLPAGPEPSESTSTLGSKAAPLPSSPPPSSPSKTSDAELDFAVIGDYGTGNLNQLAVAARMCAWRENHPFDLVITTGDNVYPEATPDRFEATFFDPYECLFQEGVQWRASLGNHDWAADEGQHVLEEPAFGMPDENYVLRESGVRFVIANSNEMDRQWLRSALPAEKGDRWTVVAFHHPVFSPGFHGSHPRRLRTCPTSSRSTESIWF